MKAELLKGDVRALSKAITLVESRKPEHRKEAQALLQDILPHTGKAKRLGISGVPGVGKSTFIEQLGLLLCEKGLKVAVLAVDPSSPISGGSIMGDKTRMEQLTRHPNAFVRPSPTDGALGGVAQKTRESMLLCEAAGYDVVLIETVGVGQSEYAVASMVDIFSVLLVPGAGDELQGIKKGIIELADLLVINKADGDQQTLAKLAKSQYESALSYIAPRSNWKVQVVTCSALKNIGLDTYWSLVEKWYSAQDKDSLHKLREKQNTSWFQEALDQLVKDKILQTPDLEKIWTECLAAISKRETTPHLAALRIFEALISSNQKR